MRNRAETMSLGNRTFSDPTAREAIRKVDNRVQTFNPTVSPINRSRTPDNPFNQMTIDQLNELSAQMRCQTKFHGEVADDKYPSLMRYIDYRKQQLKKKAKR